MNNWLSRFWRFAESLTFALAAFFFIAAVYFWDTYHDPEMFISGVFCGIMMWLISYGITFDRLTMVINEYAALIDELEERVSVLEDIVGVSGLYENTGSEEGEA